MIVMETKYPTASKKNRQSTNVKLAVFLSGAVQCRAQKN
jgi:hypothetical protein